MTTKENGKVLLRRPLATKTKSTGESANAIDDLVEDLNEIFERNLSQIYQTADENSSYDADSTSEGSSLISREKRHLSPRTDYLKSMMRKKGSRARDFTDDDLSRFHSHNSQPLVQPYRTRGPRPFHLSHSVKQPSAVSMAYLNAFEEVQQQELRVGGREGDPQEQQDTFTLEDFRQPVMRGRPRLARSALKEAVLSRHNYEKLTKLFAEVAFKTDQDHVHQIYLSGEEVPAVAHRIPWRQLVLEMAAILQEEAKTMRDQVATAQKAYNKFIKTAQGAAEIVGREPERFEPVLRSDSDVYQYTAAKFFDNLERSDSPIEKVDESALITSDELAVLDSMVCGGVALSLKAQFISRVPDLSPLSSSLKYLNLSFNELKALPNIIFELKNLEILKMRSNPVTVLPAGISSLGKLKCLVMAYCNIKSIPLALFDLTSLEILDFRYNMLTYMPPEIRNLKKLRELNVEGNQLTFMPCGLLRLRKMRVLSIRNNFMHPLLWRSLTKDNSVQSLKELCCTIISRNKIDVHSAKKKVPQNIINILEPEGVCDCCGHGMYGDGLRVVRPARKIFGCLNVPFLFLSCSPYCLSEFNHNSKTTAHYIYRDED